MESSPTPRPLFRLRLRDERGMSLIELLTVMPMLAIVLLGIYGLYNVGAKSQQETNTRVRSLMQQQSGMERISREMRQATAITPVSSQIIDATTWVRPTSGGASVQRRVRYDCSTGTCNRWEGPAGGSLTTGPVPIITNVVNADIFDLQPNSVDPTYVVMRVEVQVQGANNPITLDGGFALRNLAADA
jgi:prepilin-type N-terminal cleavage/methylation domain-containing protein